MRVEHEIVGVWARDGVFDILQQNTLRATKQPVVLSKVVLQNAVHCSDSGSGASGSVAMSRLSTPMCARTRVLRISVAHPRFNRAKAGNAHPFNFSTHSHISRRNEVLMRTSWGALILRYNYVQASAFSFL